MYPMTIDKVGCFEIKTIDPKTTTPPPQGNLYYIIDTRGAGHHYLHFNGKIHPHASGGGWYKTPRECYEAIDRWESENKVPDSNDSYKIGYGDGYEDAYKKTLEEVITLLQDKLNGI